MIKILIENPLILLFLVAAIGYPLGHIRIGGSSLGVAAVLFVGLAIGSLDPNMKLPEIIYVLGLALFVYTVGLSSGPSFTASLLREGLRNNLLIAGILIFVAALTVVVQKIFHLKATITVGMFAGSFTNTPALAGALETIKHLAPKETLNQLVTEPVVGYSIAYPMGVIGVVIAISIAQKLWNIDYVKEAKSLRMFGSLNEVLNVRTARVRNQEALAATIEELNEKHDWHVMFGRIKRKGRFLMANPSARFELDDQVAVVGVEEDLDAAMNFLGGQSSEDIHFERSEFDTRRIFVSNPKVVGRKIKTLHLNEQHGAMITRIRRGDADFLAHGDTILELGDRVRVLAPRDNMNAVSDYFGDSYRAVSEVDILTFSFGLALGLLLGIIPIPLPGGITFRLGFAGGPLIVALILGTIGRTGKLVWTLPYSANMTLRQIGLVFFLAGIGTRAGYGFLSTFTNGGGITIFLAGAVLTLIAAVTTLWIGHRLMRIPMSLLIGMVAGLFTQPAVLGYALEQTDNDLPNIGYASVYPMAMIAKILLAQALLSIVT
ncbi:aspartate:alanine exchanger family transporter [Pelotalea chapellei]|uniref:Transporter n=1 Tax=Pelotalea chapellei TaxID=44671 RepID=A0ABS5UAY1_9BACT|nr:aspartate:alanine exchanger family transporter [Pelotalea chapellei]MBT1072836.1 transporter [Pelotalea chapellei]